MSREDLVAVAARMFAVFLFVTLIRYLPSAAVLIHQEGSRKYMLVLVLVLVFSFSVCAILWFFPLTIARKLLPVMREPRSETAMSGSITLSVGITIIGLWLLTSALPDMIYWSTIFVMTRQFNAGYFTWQYEQIAKITSTVMELVLAIWLIFGSSGIKRLIYKFRYGSYVDK